LRIAGNTCILGARASETICPAGIALLDIEYRCAVESAGTICDAGVDIEGEGRLAGEAICGGDTAVLAGRLVAE